MMLSKSSTILRAASSTTAARARFSTSTRGSGAPRKMQKLFIDYLDDAQGKMAQRNVTNGDPSAATKEATKGSVVDPASRRTQPGHKKRFIDYLEKAEAEIAAKKGAK